MGRNDTAGGRPHLPRFERIGGRQVVLATVCLGLLTSGLQGQAESLPISDPAVSQLQAQAPMAFAHFGYTATSGRLRGFSDAKDDVILCAIDEGEGSFTQVGAAYIFENDLLTAPDDKPKRLTPTPPQHDLMQLGRLSAVVANLRGDNDVTGNPRDNLILIGCWGRRAEYPTCEASVPGGGSVEMYDWNSNQVPIPQKSIIAPLNPTSSMCPGDAMTGLSCPASVPFEVQHFGTGVAVGDVTRDGIPDLIVGAPGTDVEEARDQKGRIYIFVPHSRTLLPPPPYNDPYDFFDDPYEQWLGINAPEPSAIGEDWGLGFGNQVAVAQLTADTAHEVIVGRPARTHRATSCPTPPCNAPQGGSAYVFRGKYLHDLFGGMAYDPVTNPTGTWQRVLCPPPTDGLNPVEPEYQVLRNPFGDLQTTGPDPRNPRWDDQFGWFVFNAGDVGSPGGGPPDLIDDIAIHSEIADYIGTGTLDAPQVPNAGAQFIYYGMGGVGVPIVDPAYVLLQRPSNVALPQTGARFGRAFARVDAWRNSTNGQLEPGLLISEPDAEWGGSSQAGIVHFIRLPLPAQPAVAWDPAPIVPETCVPCE